MSGNVQASGSASTAAGVACSTVGKPCATSQSWVRCLSAAIVDDVAVRQRDRGADLVELVAVGHPHRHLGVDRRDEQVDVVLQAQLERAGARMSGRRGAERGSPRRRRGRRSSTRSSRWRGLARRSPSASSARRNPRSSSTRRPADETRTVTGSPMVTTGCSAPVPTTSALGGAGAGELGPGGVALVADAVTPHHAVARCRGGCACRGAATCGRRTRRPCRVARPTTARCGRLPAPNR